MTSIVTQSLNLIWAKARKDSIEYLKNNAFTIGMTIAVSVIGIVIFFAVFRRRVRDMIERGFHTPNQEFIPANGTPPARVYIFGGTNWCPVWKQRSHIYREFGETIPQYNSPGVRFETVFVDADNPDDPNYSLVQKWGIKHSPVVERVYNGNRSQFDSANTLTTVESLIQFATKGTPFTPLPPDE